MAREGERRGGGARAKGPAKRATKPSAKPGTKAGTRPATSSLVPKGARKADPRQSSSDRPVRVAAQLRQELAQLVGRDLADPRLEGLVVSNAWISNDLRLAKIYFRIATTAEGTELAARRADAEKALERASGRLRRVVTGRLGLRVAPELTFIYDEGQDARNRIELILDEVKRDRERDERGERK